MTDYFTPDGNPVAQSRGVSSQLRTLFTAIQTGFGKVAGYTGNGNKLVKINSGATAQEAMALGTANQVLGMNSGGTAYEHKTIAGTANEITVTHGANSVTASIPAAVTMTGKTITGGTYESPTINTPTISSPTITGGSFTGGTDIAVADGGTGASTAAGARTNLGVAIGTDVQAYDADLSAVAGVSSAGLIARTGSGTASARTLTAPAAGITVSNGDGVSGNPTIALANDLAALEGLSATGLISRTGDGTASARTLTAPAAGITVTNGDGVSGNPTLALANDLAALEGLAATGLIARTGDGTAEARTITAGSGCSVANGNGVSGNPTVSLIPGVGLGDVLSSGAVTTGTLVVHSGTTGQVVTQSTLTGVLKATSGVPAAAVAGTDYVAPGGALGTPSSGNLGSCTGLPQAGTVGLTTADSPEFAAINLGHASDTTLTRVSAGVGAIEGVTIATVGANVFTGQQTFAEVKDTVYTITDGAAFEIDPANGSVQIVTLGASRTPAATNFEAGQTVLLGIDDGTAYSVTWTTVAPTWVTPGGTAAAPTLATSGYTWILLWKVGSTVYGAEVGQP